MLQAFLGLLVRTLTLCPQHILSREEAGVNVFELGEENMSSPLTHRHTSTHRETHMYIPKHTHACKHMYMLSKDMNGTWMNGKQIVASALQHTRRHCSGWSSVEAEGSSLDHTTRTI